MSESRQAELEAVLRGIEERHGELSKLDKIIGHLASCGFCGDDDPRACVEGGALYREWNDGKIGTGDGVRAEQARTVERMVEAAQNRIDALESLLVCYRVGRQPTEALHEKLQTSRETWVAALRAGEENEHV